MNRVPINHTQYEVVMSQEPAKFADLLPKYRYEFQSITIPEESNQMYQSLIEFIETNQSLALSGEITDAYQKGFQNCLALVRLWVDSLYLENKSKTTET